MAQLLPHEAADLEPALEACEHYLPLPLTEQDEFVLLGSDGLWDGMLYQEAVDAVHAWRRERGTIAGVAESLVQLSIDRNVPDNVTCVVVAFDGL